MKHQVAALAETDLDGIWHYIATQSGSIDVADRLVDSITDRFSVLAQFPQMGRSHETEFGAGSRSFPVGEYLIFYDVSGEEIEIVRILHGRRKVDSLYQG